MSGPAFQESTFNDLPMRELGLTIAGTALEGLLQRFERELDERGISVKPRFYLSTEWGVPFQTVAIAIPFYLARRELTEWHAAQTGLVEGTDPEEILRYLRHEMGHVINYAYRLYERPDWISAFGSMTQPYEEEYRPEPWSRRFVRHLPGWYAQKHPDEDWAETFAVWMTPHSDWREEYAAWPVALAKLERCDAIMRDVRERRPLYTDDDLDEDLGEIEYSLRTLYERNAPAATEMPPGIEGALRAIFVEPAAMRGALPASQLIARHARHLVRAVFTWTGHFPEATRPLLQQLAVRADALGLVYTPPREIEALLSLAAFVTSLAMNHVHRGSYVP